MHGAVEIVAAAVGHVTLGLVQLAPDYLHLPFSMRAASRDLSVLMAGSSHDIGTANAEGLFSDNALPTFSGTGGRRGSPRSS